MNARQRLLIPEIRAELPFLLTADVASRKRGELEETSG